MNYSIFVTPRAESDLNDIYTYLAFSLYEPSTAESLYQSILKAIYSLEQPPHRYPLYEEEPWFSKGYHKLLVKKYLVFYSIDENLHQIRIVRILYGGRDIGAQLSE